MSKSSDKTTLTTAVYQKLRSDIIRGAFKPGEKLRIEGIASLYEAGSNAVREALARLSSERLVERHEQRGFSVPTIALDDWRILVKTRCWLETQALRESMLHRDEHGRRPSSLPFTASRASARTLRRIGRGGRTRTAIFTARFWPIAVLRGSSSSATSWRITPCVTSRSPMLIARSGVTGRPSTKIS
jgi:DNA-binding transcriptional MocR family regulator